MNVGVRTFIVLFASFVLCHGGAWAQAWPSRPVSLVVPAAPGGGSDFLGRLFAEHLGEALGQAVVVDNVPGAANTIGHGAAAKAPPDGYRLLISDSGQAIFPALYPNLSFDPIAHLEQISLFIEVPVAITVAAKLNARTLAEFITLAKSTPGKLNVGTGGAGTANHIAGEIFKKITGTDFVHVPYKGAGPMMAALVGGQVDVIFATSTTAGLAGQHNAGAVRVLAVSGSKRLSSLPQVPSAPEVGLPDYMYSIWWGLAAPKGTPQPIIARLGDEVRKFLARPNTQKRMAEYGATILGTSQAEAQARLLRDTKELSALVTQLGITQ